MNDQPADGERPRWIAVGRVARAHGVKGEVSVLPLSQVSERFRAGSRLFFEGSDHGPEGRQLTVSASRPHRQRLLVSFEEIPDRTAAEAITGRYLLVPASTAPSLPDGEFWTHELVGCDVEAEGGRPVGRIREVIHTQANDVWVAVDRDGNETLIPALKDVVLEVDVAASRIRVRDVPGLTSP